MRGQGVGDQWSTERRGEKGTGAEELFSVKGDFKHVEGMVNFIFRELLEVHRFRAKQFVV